MTSNISLTNSNILAFELRGGGSGVALSATTTAARYAAPGMKAGETIMVCNEGDVTFWFKLGDGSVVADLSCVPVLPGTKEVFTVADDGGTYTYVSVITRTGSAYGTLNYGFGT